MLATLKKQIDQIVQNKVKGYFYIFVSDEKEVLNEAIFLLVEKLVKSRDETFSRDIHKYWDLIQLDGKKTVKKNEILDAIKKLKETALEKSQLKFLIIENIDYLSSIVSNSLLKITEETPENSFIITSVKNSANILPTLKSRAQIISLSSQVNNNFSDDALFSWVKQKNKEKDFGQTRSVYDQLLELIDVLKESIISAKEHLYLFLKGKLTKNNFLIYLNFLKLFFNEIWRFKNKINNILKEQKILDILLLYSKKNFRYEKALFAIDDFLISVEKKVNFDLAKIRMLLEIMDCYEK